MKMYISSNRIMLAGKALEIRHMLKKYSQSYTTVAEWIQAMQAE